MQIDVNYWAVLVCGVSAMVLGFLWYGPLFGKAWAKEMGWDMTSRETVEKMQKSATWNYPQQFITALLMAFVFAHVLGAFKSDTIGMGLQGAFWMWLGFIVPLKYGEKLWGGKSMKLFWIDGIYSLVQLGIFAAILVSWKA